jgi:pimeloyl-ACP methyl ester carboxylesterase
MERTITTPHGLTLWTESFGDPGKPCILLIMGAMNPGIFWPDGFRARLADAGYYVIRYDHRDTGLSSKVSYLLAPYDLDALTRDALAVLDGHSVGRAHVVGLSMGGYIAQLLAIDHPERVDHLALISTSADHRPYMAATMGQSTAWFSLPGPEPALLDYIHATVANPPRTADALLANRLEGWRVTYDGSRTFPHYQVEQALRLAAQRCPDQTASFQHGLAVAASPDRLDAVKRIAAPTLVVHGRHDACLPLAHGEYLARRIPGARFEVFDMGHAFMWQWDDEVASAILASLL